MTNAGIAPFAKKQYGLVTMRQALTVMTLERVKHEIACGRLERMRRLVLRVAGTPESWSQCVMAVCLARPDTVASFSTAAALWGLPGFEQGDIEVLIEGTRRVRLDGAIVHETTVWGPRHLGVRMRIPVTSAARTLCDLSTLVCAERLGQVVDDALRRKLVTLRQLKLAANELDGQGRRRCTTTRVVLGERVPGYQPGDSEPERRIARWLAEAGLPKPVLGHRVAIGNRRLRLDVAYPDIKFAFEYDSPKFHDDTSAFFADRDRDALLDEIDWAIKRITKRTRHDQVVGMAIRAHERAGLPLPFTKTRQKRRI